MCARVLKAAAAALSLTFAAGAASAASLVTNGGFETPDVSGIGNFVVVDGWTGSGPSGLIELWDNGFAIEGDQHAELNGRGLETISQTISGVAAGSTLEFSFLHRARGNGTETLSFSIFDVNGGDTQLFSKQYTASSTSTWDTNNSASEAVISALGGDIRIEFTALSGTSNSVGNFIDDVQLHATPIPVPASVLLLGTAMAGLGAMRAKRRKAA